MITNMGVLGNEKMMFKFEETVKYFTVEDAYELYSTSCVAPEILVNGKWTECSIQKHEPKNMVRVKYKVHAKKSEDYEDELLVPESTRIQTHSGLLRAERMRPNAILLNQWRRFIPNVTNRYAKNKDNEMHCTYSDGRLIAILIRYAVEIFHPERGVHFRLLIDDDRIKSLMYFRSKGTYVPKPNDLEKLADIEESPFEGQSYVTLWLPDTASAVNKYRKSDNMEYGEFDESILLEGHDFCDGFINGWIFGGVHPFPDECFEFNDYDETKEKIKYIAELAGYNIIQDPDSPELHKIVRDKKEYIVRSIENAHIEMEYYTINVKNKLCPYYAVRNYILISDEEVEII